MAEEEDFISLKRLVFSKTELDCSQYKDRYLKRRFLVRMRANHIDDYGDYQRYLIRNPEEYEILMNTITINVTQFFRDPSMYTYLGEYILPDIIYNKTNNGRRVFRIWSAGSSSGEEAYSITIMVKDLLGDRVDDFLLSVHGTDIDEECLEKAKKGSYPITQLKNLDKGQLDRYFDYDGELYTIKQEIKNYVRFRKHNLIKDRKPKNFDIIFNRNVMIYFSREMQENLLLGFYDSLNKGGYLILGKTEMLVGEARGLFKTIDNKERIYKKEK